MANTHYQINTTERQIPRKITVTTGNTATVWLDGNTRGVAVRAAPGGGGSALVESSMDVQSDVTGGTATWVEWDSSTVSAATDAVIEANRVAALRLTATGANATFYVG